MTGQSGGHLKGLVAANIDAAIEQAGLSTAEVARQMQTGEKAVRRWRQGKITPSQKNMTRLALLLTDGDVSALYREGEPVA